MNDISLVTAEQFIKKLDEYESEKNSEKQDAAAKKETDFSNVSMGRVFVLAKEFIDMPPNEIEKLLKNTAHKARVGAVSIMDFQARRKKTSPQRKKELFDMYIRLHDKIDTWDLVDRSAPYVVGGYLYDKPRNILYKLARSKNMSERRTAIVSTYYFIRLGDIEDTFKIAEILAHDTEDLVQKAVGSWIREAGKKDTARLYNYLDKYAATLPRITLRYAIEKLDKTKRDYYLELKKSKI